MRERRGMAGQAMASAHPTWDRLGAGMVPMRLGWWWARFQQLRFSSRLGWLLVSMRSLTMW